MALHSALSKLFGGRVQPVDEEHARRLAVAQLLLEIARSDLTIAEAEMKVVRSHLARAYALDDAQLDALVAAAGAHVERAVSLHGTVQVINQALGPEDKARIIGGLWQVAYADGRLDPYEEALLRRLADLLYVPHATFIREKLKAAPKP
jgi:uncharacterized tellurite resistance protein B-like protein